MARDTGRSKLLFMFVLSIIPLITACGGTPETAAPTVAATPTVQVDLPRIISIEADRNEVPRYESIELTVDFGAEYANPYNAQEVALEGIFTGPDSASMTVPGFWDAEGSWKLRFTPSQEGLWTFSISVRDARGNSLPSLGEFTVVASDLHGWIIPGNSFDPAYSAR